MKYTSTRDSALHVDASMAILTGIAPDGGLFVPEELPVCMPSEVYGLTYPQTAQKVLSLFLTDYDADFLKAATESVYSAENFGGKAGFVHPVANRLCALELWHGPTCAFKDYALQLMPRLLVQAKKNLRDESLTKILVATSGDTGKAALAGYAGLDGIQIAVFYPDSGTSEMQRLQMVTQEGENVAVYAVNGNFDDAQTGVKRVFADAAVTRLLAAQNAHLSSANSINWGRLVPQIVYYFYSYAQLVASGTVKDGETVDYCVPTGNFGDILAGYYAKRMGLPVGHLLCASNKNNVLTEFLRTGVYDANRKFYKTTSPSMDILVSSNLERLLYHVTNDAQRVRGWMEELARTGRYTVPAEVLGVMQETFLGGCAEDGQAAQTIAQYHKSCGYTMDPHTAVAFYVQAEHADTGRTTVVLSTASPYKFAGDVLAALGESVPTDIFAAVEALRIKTGLPVPQSLAELKTKKVRFTRTIDAADIAKAALSL
ncbi:MAG: threonine synthase [Ruthenibacterium sp.]